MIKGCWLGIWRDNSQDYFFMTDDKKILAAVTRKPSGSFRPSYLQCSNHVIKITSILQSTGGMELPFKKGGLGV